MEVPQSGYVLACIVVGVGGSQYCMYILFGDHICKTTIIGSYFILILYNIDLIIS